MMTRAWVIGARGLLGSAVKREIDRRHDWQAAVASPMPWDGSNEDLAQAARVSAAELFATIEGDDTWCIIWAAGRVVTSSTTEEFAHELSQFRAILDGIEDAVSAAGPQLGAMFYASSAGGVYAGSANPPFTEHTEPLPIAQYGRFKLDAEAELAMFSARTGLSTVIGRIANLYGPGQSLHKMQGLISHLARAQLSPAPASVYVPLDTLRDYIYVDDCAGLALDCINRSLATARIEGPTVTIKNLASGQGVTIAALISYLRTISKKNANVMLGSSAAATLQAHDLRLASVVWPELDEREQTPLPVGMHRTLDEMRALMQQGSGGS